MNKKFLVSIGLASTLTFSSLTSYAAVFSDVQGHWAQSIIEWGKQNGYVSGYEDGSFKPDKQVTEAEFTTMLIATFHLKLDPVTPQTHWADDFYGYAKKMNYPLLGFDNLDARNQPISRNQVAELVASVQGQNLTGEEAIKYLLVNGLSHGKISATVSGYAGGDNLTRAEAISFIKNVLEKGLSNPLARPSTPTSTTQLDQQYQQMVQQQQPSQPVQQQQGQPGNFQKTSSIWSPGPVRVLGDQLFPTYKDNGDSVTVTMPTIDGYGHLFTYRTEGYKANNPRYKYMVLQPGQTYTFNKGDGGAIHTSIQGGDYGATVEAYSIRIDDGMVYDITNTWVPLDAIFQGLGVTP